MSKTIQNRLQQVRNHLVDWGVDAILVGSDTNRRWLSGFTGSAGWVLISQDAAILATDFRYWQQAELESPDYTLFKLHRQPGELEGFVAEFSLAMMGIEGKKLSLHDFRRFRKIESKSIKWKSVGDRIDSLRHVKSREEIFLIRQAAAITDMAMSQFPEIAQPGHSEKALAWELEKIMREAGADGLAFPIIVAAGRNSAKPHHRPSNRTLVEGDSIVVDMGAQVGGYRSDLTRTFYLGSEPDEQFWSIYNLVWEAEQHAIDQLNAGMTGAQADALARDLITQAGYGEAFGHGLGHGVGLDIHEGPSLSRRNEKALPAGAVVTVEPGIYLPEWGGVRIEDLVLLENNGVTRLSQCPKSPIIPV